MATHHNMIHGNCTQPWKLQTITDSSKQFLTSPPHAAAACFSAVGRLLLWDRTCNASTGMWPQEQCHTVLGGQHSIPSPSTSKSKPAQRSKWFSASSIRSAPMSLHKVKSNLDGPSAMFEWDGTLQKYAQTSSAASRAKAAFIMLLAYLERAEADTQACLAASLSMKINTWLPLSKIGPSSYKVWHDFGFKNQLFRARLAPTMHCLWRDHFSKTSPRPQLLVN